MKYICCILLLNLANTKPTKKKIFHNVIPHVASKWYELGVELLLEEQEPQLDLIKLNYNHDIHKCSTEMFWLWLQTHPDANWYHLVKCLKSPSVQLYTLAADIEKIFAGTLYNIHVLLSHLKSKEG